jgi:hypothetical protein
VQDAVHKDTFASNSPRSFDELFPLLSNQEGVAFAKILETTPWANINAPPKKEVVPQNTADASKRSSPAKEDIGKINQVQMKLIVDLTASILPENGLWTRECVPRAMDQQTADKATPLLDGLDTSEKINFNGTMALYFCY